MQINATDLEKREKTNEELATRQRPLEETLHSLTGIVGNRKAAVELS